MSRAEQKRIEYATELKLAAVRRVLAGESVRAVAEGCSPRDLPQFFNKPSHLEQRKGRRCRDALVANPKQASS